METLKAIFKFSVFSVFMFLFVLALFEGIDREIERQEEIAAYNWSVYKYE